MRCAPKFLRDLWSGIKKIALPFVKEAWPIVVRTLVEHVLRQLF
jgi:hypothetical protein